MGIGEKFTKFCEDISIPSDKRSSISYRYKRMTKQLNKDFWGSDSETDHSRYVGSYGRGTASNTFSDLDMIFQLPYSYYERYNNYKSNGQSALLQEVKDSIGRTYKVTDSKGDGQVVVVAFDDNITFEIVPCFINNDNSFTYPDSNNGGSWKTTNPIPEINEIAKIDSECNNNLKNLCKMMRAWKDKWDVPMGGLLIDSLAAKFIQTWQYRDKSYFYYDYITRDFLKYLSEQNKTQNYWRALGSNQYIYRKGIFENKAKECYDIALKAIEAENNNYIVTANQRWREIYGTKFPG